MELADYLLIHWKPSSSEQQIPPCFSVELPAVDAGMETWACPGHWECGGDESGRANPSECSLCGQSDQRGERKAGFPLLLWYSQTGELQSM